MTLSLPGTLHPLTTHSSPTLSPNPSCTCISFISTAGDRDDDREESISLWNRPSTDGLELQDESDPDLPQGGIRLVPNTRNRSDVL